MAQLFKNNARATLGGSGLASTVGVDGTFSVATGKGALFPGIDPIVAGTYFDVTLQDATNIEIIRIKKRASDVFTIDSRALEGTTASTFASGAIVALRLTAAVIESTLAHPATTTGAHAASSISNAPSGNIAATTVQAALNELDTEKATPAQITSEVTTAVNNHIAAADPHTQYALDSDLTNGLAGKQAADAALTSLAGLVIAEGDLIYGTGPDALAKLPKGTASQVLRMNGTSTAPEWAAPAVSSVTGTAPVVSSGGTTPAISMPAATASAAGHMSAAYASKLDGIQAGATAGPSNNVGVDGLGQFCLCSLQAASLAQGADIAGSSLRYVKSTSAPSWVDGFQPTGTYKLLGSGLSIGEVGMFQRIA